MADEAASSAPPDQQADPSANAPPPDLAKQIAELTAERNEATAKAEKLAADFDKEKAAVQNAAKEKADLEKQLKKAVAFVNKTRDKQALQALMDEHAKMRSDLELLGDQKLQNDALKENMHAIVAQGETYKKLLETRCDVLLKHLKDVCASANVPVPPDVGTLPPIPKRLKQDDIKQHTTDAVSDTANMEIMQAQVKVLETIQADLRADKQKLEETVNVIKFEMEEVKTALEAERKRNGGAGETGGLAALAGAGQAAKSWWTRQQQQQQQSAASGQPAAQMNGQQPQVPLGQSSSTIASTSSEHLFESRSSLVHPPAQAAGQASAATVAPVANTASTLSLASSTAPAPAQQQAAAGARAATATATASATSWWSRTTAAASSASTGQSGSLASVAGVSAVAAVVAPTVSVSGPDAPSHPPITQEQFNELKNDKHRLEAQLKTAHDDIQQLKSKLDHAKSAQTQMQTQTPSADHSSAAHQEEVSALRAKVQQQQSLLDTQHQQHEQISGTVHSLTSQLESKALQVKELESSLDRVKQLLDEKTTAYTQVTDQQAQTATKVAELERQVASLVSSHAKEIATLSEKHQKETVQLRDEHAAAIVAAASQHSAAPPKDASQDGPASQQTHDVDQLKAAQQQEIDNLKRKHADEVDSLQQSIKSFESQVQALQSQLKESVDRMSGAQTDGVVDGANAADAVNKAVEEASTRHQIAISALRETHAADIQALKDKHAQEISSLALQGTEAAKTIKSLEARLAALETESVASRSTAEEDRKTLVHKFEQQIQALEQQVKAQVSDTAALDAMKLRHQAELDEKQTQLKKEIEKHEAAIKQLEGKHQTSLKDARASLEKSLADSTVQLATLQKQTSARIAELEAQTAKQREDTAVVEKKLETTKKEVETMQKQASKNKEVSEMLVKSLQEQINQLSADKAAAEKKIRAEMDEKAKKDRLDLETKNTKDKIDIEERFKKEKLKLTGDLDKARKDFDTYKADSTKKFEKDLATKGEELAKTSARLKAVELELQTAKTEHTKAIDALSAKMADATKQLTAKSADADKLKADETHMRSEIQSLTEQIANLQSKHDVLSQELEVAHASNERSSKTLQERDDANKKLKARNEELLHAETGLKRSAAKLEKEREEATAQAAQLKSRLDELEATLKRQEAELSLAQNSTGSKIDELQALVDKLTQDNRTMAKKLADTENEMKIVERKSTQIVKDLQKQLMKERKQKEEDAEAYGSGPRATTSSAPAAHVPNTSTTHLHDPSAPATNTNNKMERLTGDLLTLAQENETLNRRVRHAEDELRSASDRINRLSDDLDQKTKIVQQYILRDHASKLQPDEKPRLGGQAFNMNILSSASAMQKVDPVILSNINMKMQKLLEELTGKMMRMEEELKRLGVQVPAS